MTTTERLDADKGVQAIIGSDAWRRDKAGAMISDALLACARAGVSIEDALDYLEIEEDEGWTDYLKQRYAETQAAVASTREGLERMGPAVLAKVR
jgi:hypothetical protein